VTAPGLLGTLFLLSAVLLVDAMQCGRTDGDETITTTALLGLTSPVLAEDPFHARIGHVSGHEVAFITNYAACSALSDETRAATAGRRRRPCREQH
jgi:hypothetical protein